MSNNIYDILKKIENLEGSRQTLTEGKKAKPDYIDIDQDGNKKEPMKKAVKDKAKSGMAEAVARVEQQLSEKFHNHKKAVEESGLMYHAGVQKHGKKYMDMAKEAGQKGASQEELGRLKDKYSKAYKNKKMDEDSYNEDMLSPKEKSFAALAEPKDKITYADRIAGAKKKQKDEGNAFSGALDAARDAGASEFKVDGKTYKVKEDNDDFLGGDDPVDQRGDLRLSPSGAAKVQQHPNYDPNQSANAQYGKHFDDRGYPRMTHDQAVQVGKHPEYNPNLPANAQHHLLNKQSNMQAMKEGQTDGPEYQATWKRTQDERKAWEKNNPGEKYYSSPKSPVDRHSMEIAKARDTDQTAKDEKRGPLGRIANTLSRGLFGQDIDEGRTSMREGWEEMQKYLEKKRGPESKGGEGKKAGTRYGGSAQQDDSEDTDGEGQPTVKKKGRPKGTGGGAKFSFKKPKD